MRKLRLLGGTHEVNSVDTPPRNRLKKLKGPRKKKPIPLGEEGNQNEEGEGKVSVSQPSGEEK